MGTYNQDFTVCQSNFSTINMVGTRGNSKYRLIVSEVSSGVRTHLNRRQYSLYIVSSIAVTFGQEIFTYKLHD